MEASNDIVIDCCEVGEMICTGAGIHVVTECEGVVECEWVCEEKGN